VGDDDGAREQLETAAAHLMAPIRAMQAFGSAVRALRPRRDPRPPELRVDRDRLFKFEMPEPPTFDIEGAARVIKRVLEEDDRISEQTRSDLARLFRERPRPSQREAARRLGISKTTVQRYWARMRDD